MNRIKEDQEKRISGLKKEQILSEFKALLLQKYIYEVQAIINIIQIMTNSGLSWGEINRQIKDERKSGNVLANMIFKLNLEKNNVSLILDAVMEDEEEDKKFQIEDVYLTNFDPVMKIDIDLLISAQLNIQKYFEIKKKSYEKELKTKDAA
jgi:predicted ribosome quality control (RQC) complex YloA/Tae2 family protein